PTWFLCSLAAAPACSRTSTAAPNTNASVWSARPQWLTTPMSERTGRRGFPGQHLAALVSGYGKWRGHGKDGGRPDERAGDVVGGRVAEQHLGVRPEGECANCVDHVGERLVVGEYLHPARHRGDGHVGARDK